MLLAANTLNLAADLAAMAEALRLLVGGSTMCMLPDSACSALVLQVFPYQRYVCAG